LNLRTVLCALNYLSQNGFSLSHDTIQRGLDHLAQNSGFYGRMQLVSKEPLLILDVSHNADGIQKTLDSIQEINQGTLHIIYGTSSDKNYEEIVALFPKDVKLYFSTFTNQRSISIEQIKQLIKKMDLDATIFSNVKSAIQHLQLTANKEDTILVFGSFFLISDFF
jgi:dihydrofolate synthase/folylpolyglutamate synthase